MFKSILRSAPIMGVMAFILAAYMAMIKRTTRWTVEGREHVAPIWDEDSGAILCVWHGRFFISNSGWPRRKKRPYVLVSKSTDGELITRAAKILGLGAIRGSAKREGSDKDRGGMQALREMVKHLKNDGIIFITPDGPRGPRMRSGDGPLIVAKMSGKPILPYALSTRNRIVFNSWDRFMLPLPFGRGAIIYGEPIYLDKRADAATIEAARAALEASTIAANIRADTLMGKEIIQPSDTAKIARNDA